MAKAFVQNDSIVFTKAAVDKAVKAGAESVEVLIAESAGRMLAHDKATLSRTGEAAYATYAAGHAGLLVITKTGGVEKESGKEYGARFGIKADNVTTVTGWWIMGHALHAGVRLGSGLWQDLSQQATYGEVKKACLADDATPDSIAEAIALWGRDGSERAKAKAEKDEKSGGRSRSDKKSDDKTVEVTLTAGQQCEMAVQMLTDNIGSVTPAEAESLHVALGKVLAALTLRGEDAKKKAEKAAARKAERDGLKVQVSA